MTLQDRITDNVEDGSKLVTKPYFYKAEETELASCFLPGCCQNRLWKARKQVMGIIESAVCDKEKLTKEKILRKQKILDGWF